MVSMLTAFLLLIPTALAETEEFSGGRTAYRFPGGPWRKAKIIVRNGSVEVRDVKSGKVVKKFVRVDRQHDSRNLRKDDGPLIQKQRYGKTSKLRSVLGFLVATVGAYLGGKLSVKIRGSGDGESPALALIATGASTYAGMIVSRIKAKVKGVAVVGRPKGGATTERMEFLLRKDHDDPFLKAAQKALR